MNRTLGRFAGAAAAVRPAPAMAAVATAVPMNSRRETFGDIANDASTPVGNRLGRERSSDRPAPSEDGPHRHTPSGPSTLIKDHLAGGASLLHPNAAAALGPRAGGVAPPSNTLGILGRRALPSGRRAPRSGPCSACTGH